jgi:hypothetical protein
MITARRRRCNGRLAGAEAGIDFRGACLDKGLEDSHNAFVSKDLWRGCLTWKNCCDTQHVDDYNSFGRVVMFEISMVMALSSSSMLIES